MSENSENCYFTFAKDLHSKSQRYVASILRFDEFEMLEYLKVYLSEPVN